MSNIKKILEEKVSEFNSRIKDEPKFSGVIEGKERSICISVSDGEKTCITYWLNKLQNLETTKNYFLTLNPIFKIDDNYVIKKIDFTHPYLNSENTALQKDLKLIQGKKRTWFCGSYFGYGFHEDGLKSSIDLMNNFKI